MSRVCFLFIGGRRDRLTQGVPTPREMFYGATELGSHGHTVDIVEERDLGPAPTAARLLAKPARRVIEADLALAARLAQVRHLADADVVIANARPHTFALGALVWAHRLKARVVSFVMGLLDSNGRVARLSRGMLRGQTLLSISENELRHIRDALPGQDVRYVPFGVDTKFWTPGEATRREDFVLSIGNDAQRDYDTLVASWRPEFPRLKIVTRRHVAPRPNIDVLEGDWRDAPFSDEEIRDLYRRARFVIVPLRQTTQPSGQSVTLQAMACGTPVILTRIAGLWDAASLEDTVTCRLVPHSDAAALSDAVRAWLREPSEAFACAGVAYERVRDRLTIERMGLALADVLESPRPRRVAA